MRLKHTLLLVIVILLPLLYVGYFILFPRQFSLLLLFCFFTREYVVTSCVRCLLWLVYVLRRDVTQVTNERLLD
jgi:hypothetical protein